MKCVLKNPGHIGSTTAQLRKERGTEVYWSVNSTSFSITFCASQTKPSSHPQTARDRIAVDRGYQARVIGIGQGHIPQIHITHTLCGTKLVRPRHD